MLVAELLFLLFFLNPQAIPKDTTITLERTECFGSCPSYKLTVSADGAVSFTGKKNVKTVGNAQSRINPKQMKQLVAAFERIDYFSLRDDYGANRVYAPAPAEGCPEMWTDYPGAYTSLTINGKTKHVAHYYGCQGTETLKKLMALENRIDEIVNIKQWVQ
jgi:hypothetical protein